MSFRKPLLLLNLILLMTGCALDEPIRAGFGAECSGVEYILMDSGSKCSWESTLEECQDSFSDTDVTDYRVYYDMHSDFKCPYQYGLCVLDEAGHYCSSYCPEGYFEEDGYCYLATISQCGSISNDCMALHPGWLSGRCEYTNTNEINNGYVCKRLQCKEAYYETEEDCVTKQQCCGEHCLDCTASTVTPEDIDQLMAQLDAQQISYDIDEMNKRVGKTFVCASIDGVRNCSPGCGSERMILCEGMCIDPTTSTTYCGAIDDCEGDEHDGEICRSDQVCGITSDGSYGCQCSDNGTIECGNICTNIASDTKNCGSCGNVCGPTPNATDMCDATICKYLCNDHYTDNGVQCCENVDNGAIIQDGDSESCHYTCHDGFDDNGVRCCEQKMNGTVVKDGANTCTYQCDPNYRWNGNDCIERDCPTNNATSCNNHTEYVCKDGEWIKSRDCETSVENATGKCKDNNLECGSYLCNSGYTNNGIRCCPTLNNGSLTKDSLSCAFECDRNYHPNAKKDNCEQNTSTDCGASHTNCNTANNATSGSCNTDGVCTITNCKSGYHLSGTGAGNTCVANSSTSCAETNSASAQNCNTLSNAYMGKCESGHCQITRCKADYHLSASSPNNTCVANSDTSCAETDSAVTHNCQSYDHAANGVCDDGQCIIHSCQSGYHLSDYSADNRCIQNSSTSCGAVDSATVYNCNSINNAADGDCVDGVCKIDDCISGYHLSSYSVGNTCILNTDSACGATSSTSTNNCNTINHAASGSCVNGSCKINRCESGYHLSGTSTGNSCNQNSDTSCGAPNSASTVNCNSINHAESGSCNSDGTCTITQCVAGYHLSGTSSGNSCVPNTNTECGKVNSASTVNCNNLSNAASGTCNSNGTCTITECITNYHLSSTSAGNSCIANSTTSCAPVDSASTKNCTLSTYSSNSENVICNTSGQCENTLCKTGYHLSAIGSNNSCTRNSSSACAPVDSTIAVNCDSLDGVSSGYCNDDTGLCHKLYCITGYHVVDTDNGQRCHANTFTECRGTYYGVSPAVNCTDNEHNGADGDCDSGSCHYTKCKTGFHLSSTSSYATCVENSVESCGTTTGTGINCNSHAETATCTSEGLCHITKCSGNYHLSSVNPGNSCEYNTANACAPTDSAHIINCNELEGVDTAFCHDGTGYCMLYCLDGYHVANSPNGPICKVNTFTECRGTYYSVPPAVDCTDSEHNGLEGNCNTGSCVYTKCKDGYHLSSSSIYATCIAN